MSNETIIKLLNTINSTDPLYIEFKKYIEESKRDEDGSLASLTLAILGAIYRIEQLSATQQIYNKIELSSNEFKEKVSSLKERLKDLDNNKISDPDDNLISFND